MIVRVFVFTVNNAAGKICYNSFGNSGFNYEGQLMMIYLEFENGCHRISLRIQIRTTSAF
jgi:hypothetical protein